MNDVSEGKSTGEIAGNTTKNIAGNVAMNALLEIGGALFNRLKGTAGDAAQNALKQAGNDVQDVQSAAPCCNASRKSEMKLNLLCKIRTVCLHSLPIDAAIDTGYNDINNIGVVTNEAVPERNQYDGTRSEGILQGSSDGTPQSCQRLAVGAESGKYLPANRVLVAEHLNQRPSVYNDSTRSITEQASAETKKAHTGAASIGGSSLHGL